ncbi:MAG: DPP IV N-terminal domain-containing protein [Bacteroidales bacterium]|nr:DPP IV N-terminal domain-containing protein [Bacteroidales bacterium]MCF8458571.1 DPP IV N-terminal domain-containing protein [Bacteroidales bacterium]
MNRSLFLTLILTLCLGSLSFGQQKELSLEDAIVGQYRQFYPEYLANLQWRGSTDAFTYIKGDSLIQQKATKPEVQVLLDLDDMNTAFYSNGLDSIKRFPYISWKDDDKLTFSIKGQEFIYNMKSKLLTEGIVFPKEGENLTKNAKGEYAYTKGDNLFFLSKEGESKQLTQDGEKGIVYGKSVHRNEFGINGGIFWSPEGNLLAFYRKDETMVSQYPLVDISTRVAELNNIYYPMAGMASHHVTLGVYNVSTGKTLYLKTGEPKEQYLTNIAWSPDEKSIYIAVLNRGQDHMKLNQYNAATGEFIATLFEEKHEKYVEPEHPVLFVPKKDDQFVWQSERDGFNHLYLYNTLGQVIKQLTMGKYEVSEVMGFDKSGRKLYFESTKESPIERHIYVVDLGNGKIEKLTSSKGTHSVQFDSDKKLFLDNWSSIDVPKQCDVVSTNGKVIRTVFKSEDKLKDYKLGEMSVFTIKADDGRTDLYCRMIKPVDFDPAKKYPAVIYVYGGPHAQMVMDSWLGGVRMWQYYMAQKGYVMLTVDNRGSAHRGLEFENCIHRQCGVIEMADQMKGVEYLKSLGYVDMDRIGVHGWSYGGFMTTSLMTHHPEKFKVGVAGGPVIDWKWYEIMYGERYMDTPEENPEGYEKTSLLPMADKLEGKLLIIHGAIDPTVVWQHSLSFIEACIKKGKQVDYFTYPRHEHNVRGYDRIHLMEKVTDYFDDYLK